MLLCTCGRLPVRRTSSENRRWSIRACNATISFSSLFLHLSHITIYLARSSIHSFCSRSVINDEQMFHFKAVKLSRLVGLYKLLNTGDMRKWGWQEVFHLHGWLPQEICSWSLGDTSTLREISQPSRIDQCVGECSSKRGGYLYPSSLSYRIQSSWWGYWTSSLWLKRIIRSRAYM